MIVMCMCVCVMLQKCRLIEDCLCDVQKYLLLYVPDKLSLVLKEFNTFIC